MEGVSFFGDLVQVLTLFCFSVICSVWFLQTTCRLIRGVCSTWMIFSVSLTTYRGYLFTFLRQTVALSGIKAYLITLAIVTSNMKGMIDSSFMVGISFYGRYFLLWSFHIRYKVMNSICYIFSPLFLFHLFSQVVTNSTFTPETYVILLLLKCLPSNATKKSLVKIVEHKLEETFSDVTWDVHLGRFILLSVPFSQQLLRLTSLYFFSFLNRPLKLDCTFPWQHSMGSEQLFTPESSKLFLCK